MAPLKVSKKEAKVEETKASSAPTVLAFYEIEDKLAASLSNQKIESEVKEITDYIRTQLHRFGSDPEAFKNQKLRDGLLVKAIRLRRLNRLSNFRNKLLRERLAGARQKVEGHFLQLQNFKNEIGHLRKAIETCLEFQSSDCDIDLVPVEEFFEKAPESITQPEVTKSDAHQLHLARLNYELLERKNILGNLQELEGRKSVLLSDIRGKEQRLSQIKPKIEALKTAAKPLLDILGLKSVDSSAFEMYKKMSFLPMELKLAYVNAGVYNELFGEDSLVISCEGEIQEAVRAREAAEQAQKNNEEDSEEEAEEEQKEEELANFEEETSGKKHRKRKSRRKERTAVLDKVQKKKDNLLSAHPISISILVPCTDVEDLKVMLTFVYLTELKCVGLKCKVEGNIENWQLFDQLHLLDDIFDGDSGNTCPNAVGNALLNMLDMNAGTCAPVTGKQYKFAQKLCGLAFSRGAEVADPATAEQCKSNSTSTLQQFELFARVIGTVKDRLTARYVLAERVKELETAKSIKTLPAELQHLQPLRVISQLTSLKPISTEDFVIFSGFSKWQKSMVDELWSAGQLETGFQYQGVVEREKFALNFLVHVPVAYPRHSSILLLVIKSPEHKSCLEYIKAVWDLETHLNTKTEQMLVDYEEQKNELFSLQMVQLCSQLDKTLETTSKKLETNEFHSDGRN